MVPGAEIVAAFADPTASLVGGVSRVECVEGCQDLGTIGAVSLIVSGVSLLLAGVAAFFAWKSWTIARTEHAEFMRKLHATARGEVTLRVTSPGGEGRLIETPADWVYVVWELGIHNVGDKLASRVGVNFLYPQDARIEGHWANSNGSLSEARAEALRTDETLPAGDGSKPEARFLHKEREAVGTITKYVDFVSLKINTGVIRGGIEIRVPVKFKIWSEDFPGEEPEAFVRDEIVIRKSHKSPGLTPTQQLMERTVRTPLDESPGGDEQ